jgi:hypothetical protein
MKLRRAVPLAAAGLLAVGTAFIGAGPAAAATPEILCIANTDVCAIANGQYPVLMEASPGVMLGNWLYNGLNHPGQIQAAYGDLCMQLDHDAGNVVIGATCNGASYQKWAAVIAPGGWAFVSQWDTTQCLTYNRDHAELDTVTCNGAWYQSFRPE